MQQQIAIDLQQALLGIEACISADYGRVTLGLMQRLREALVAAAIAPAETGGTGDDHA